LRGPPSLLISGRHHIFRSCDTSHPSDIRVAFDPTGGTWSLVATGDLGVEGCGYTIVRTVAEDDPIVIGANKIGPAN
jgi:hypothetical protein